MRTYRAMSCRKEGRPPRARAYARRTPADTTPVARDSEEVRPPVAGAAGAAGAEGTRGPGCVGEALSLSLRRVLRRPDLVRGASS